MSRQQATNLELGQDTARSNLLTNGGFRIWQRGVGPFTTGYSADRWGVGGGGTGGTHSVSQQSSTLGGAVSNILQDVFTYGNAAGSIFQILKMTDCDLRGRTITASAWMYCYQANAMRLNLASDGTNAQNIGAFCPIGVWTKLTVTIAVPTDATTVWFEMYMTASCNALIGQATLVIGAVAADYVPLHPAEELARCLRYYEIIGGGTALIFSGYSGAASQVFYYSMPYKVVKPISPTITQLGQWTGVASNVTTIVNDATTPTMSRWALTATAAGPYYINPQPIGFSVEANP